jgi:hypothetical protein
MLPWRLQNHYPVNRNMVEWKSIGFLGFSQGGLVAACTAARDNRVDLYRINPVSEIQKNYQGPLMVLCGMQDPILWPQPLMSEPYMLYHEGPEKLVMLDADHAFNWWDGPEPQKLHDAIYWSAAWFLYTLQ